MATKIKGIYKTFKYISQIFVVKDREIDIGYPTDVKHVAHIGWDGPSGSGPSWMNEFRTAPNFSTSLGNYGDLRNTNPIAITSWSTQDFDESKVNEPKSDRFKDNPPSELPHASKKNKRRKTKSTSSPRSSSSSSRHSSRAARSKTSYGEREASQIVQV